MSSYKRSSALDGWTDVITSSSSSIEGRHDLRHSMLFVESHPAQLHIFKRNCTVCACTQVEGAPLYTQCMVRH